MSAQANPTATRAQLEPDVLDSAASVSRPKATVARLAFTILAALAVALVLCAAVCLLPENDYQSSSRAASGFADIRLRLFRRPRVRWQRASGQSQLVAWFAPL